MTSATQYACSCHLYQIISRNDISPSALMVLSVKLTTVYETVTCGQRENVNYHDSLLSGCDAKRQVSSWTGLLQSAPYPAGIILAA